MQLDRRHFGIGAAATLVSAPLAARRGRPRPLKLLVLGGRNFVGPAIVERALASGHSVTLLNRGQTNPDLFPGLELIRADRDPERTDLTGLAGNRVWDAAIDVWPSDPRISEATASLLKDRVGRYLYISSVVAYKDLARIGASETDPLFDDPSNGDAWYEFEKAESERRLMAMLGERYSSVRPPVIAGWRQGSDSFRFWAARIARGGEVLAPGDGSDPVQFTDVRDIGDFAVTIIERNLIGAFNVVGPATSPIRFRDFLNALNRASGNKAKLVWVDRGFLEKRGVRPWVDLPLWRPLAIARRPGFMQVSSAKALSAGLRFRSIAQTAADELRWFGRSHPLDYDFGASNRASFSTAREQAVLAEWKAAAGLGAR
jgi:2'-hydroxyisoflavone reductase